MKSKSVDLFSQVQILRMDTRYIFLRSRLVTMKINGMKNDGMKGMKEH